MTAPDLGGPIRVAIVETTSISDQLAKWKGAPAVFTRRPLPDDAQNVLILVNPDAAVGDDDVLNSERPIMVRDVAVYGTKGPAGDPSDQTRKVEQIAWALRDLFHRKKFSVRPEGFSVIDVVVAGPIPAPVDDEETVGRLISLTVRLRRDDQ